MNQSAILKVLHETINKNLSDLGNDTKLFEMSDGGALQDPKEGSKAMVCLGISDVSQLSPDKNGQKIEEDQMIYEAPARLGCTLFLKVLSKYYPQLLETTGILIQYFKDNNTIQLQDYKWHGESEGKIFIEPVIRKPEIKREPYVSGLPVIMLEYILEVGINSLRGVPFKRVEKMSVKGGIMSE